MSDAKPPRPSPRLAAAEPPAEIVEVDVPVTVPPPRAPATAELDVPTRNRVALAIARAIAAELGEVRISSVPPPSEPAPRSSMRAAASGVGKVGKWSVFASGALSIVGTLIALCFRPEYAAPLAQALKLIAGVLAAMAGGGSPSH